MIRSRWPAVHRWNGRLYLLSALGLALGGLWLTWVRGTWLNLIGAFLSGLALNRLIPRTSPLSRTRDVNTRAWSGPSATDS